MKVITNDVIQGIIKSYAYYHAKNRHLKIQNTMDIHNETFLITFKLIEKGHLLYVKIRKNNVNLKQKYILDGHVIFLKYTDLSCTLIKTYKELPRLTINKKSVTGFE